jgi:hypothetical protein
MSADISPAPVVAQYMPNNVHFENTDFTRGMRYATASIDMVHARQIILGVRPLGLSCKSLAHRL